MPFTYRELRQKEEDGDSKLGNYLRVHSKKFSEQKQIHVFVTTFNVNKRMPPIDLQQWLGRDTSTLPQIVVIGLQEADGYFGLVGNRALCDTWLERVEANLPCGYQALAYVKLRGIVLALFHRTTVPLSDIQSATKATGLFGMMGNKGGAALSLRIYDTSVCFVNCHLDAGRNPESAQVRNRQYHLIANMGFPSGATVLDHDIVIWTGDLNYRLRLPSMATDMSVFSMCTSDQCLRLLKYDELQQQRASRLAFEGFQESKIKFRPTYCFQANEQQWNLARVPAWCDRILWWQRKKTRPSVVRQIDYSSVPEVTASDHKPVCSRFDLMCTKINWERRERVVSDFKKKKRTHSEDKCDAFCCRH